MKSLILISILGLLLMGCAKESGQSEQAAPAQSITSEQPNATNENYKVIGPWVNWTSYRDSRLGLIYYTNHYEFFSDGTYEIRHFSQYTQATTAPIYTRTEKGVYSVSSNVISLEITSSTCPQYIAHGERMTIILDGPNANLELTWPSNGGSGSIYLDQNKSRILYNYDGQRTEFSCTR